MNILALLLFFCLTSQVISMLSFMEPHPRRSLGIASGAFLIKGEHVYIYVNESVFYSCILTATTWSTTLYIQYIYLSSHVCVCVCVFFLSPAPLVLYRGEGLLG